MSIDIFGTQSYLLTINIELLAQQVYPPNVLYVHALSVLFSITEIHFPLCPFIYVEPIYQFVTCYQLYVFPVLFICFVFYYKIKER